MAIDSGYPCAMFNLGNYYRYIEEKYLEMINTFLMAAEKGDFKSNFLFRNYNLSRFKYALVTIQQHSVLKTVLNSKYSFLRIIFSPIELLDCHSCLKRFYW